jgi:DNA-binding LacI/PurR family transcriptional regulator
MKVHEAAERLGYRPNGVARSLVRGKTNRIGIYGGYLAGRPDEPFSGAILRAIFEEAGLNNLDVVMHTNGGRDGRALDLVANRAIDGLILHANAKDAILPLLGELRVPAIAIADRIEALPSIVADDREAGAMLALHLHQCGHRRVLVKRVRFGSSRSTIDRFLGFLGAAEALGLQCDESEVEVADGKVITRADFETLSSKTNRVTAVMHSHESHAVRACEEMVALGLRIPGDVAVVTCDSYESLFAKRYNVTSIRLPWHEVGVRAVAQLMALIRGESVPAMTVIPGEFVRGETT